MMAKVGIPRALLYYQYYPLWKTFFEELGAEIVVSDYTTKKILDEGVKACVDEACLAVKVYYGHVLNLKDRVDYLFVPRFTSVSKNEYICPKFGGLPDMVKSNFVNLPQLIDTEVNMRKSRNNSMEAALEIGSFFSDDPIRINRAYRNAVQSYREYREQVKKGVLPTDILDKKISVLKKAQDKMLNIAVIGHGYNLYDSYINMDMLKKLRREDVNLLTVEMMDNDTINRHSAAIQKKMFWNFGRKAVGTALHLMEKEEVDGIVYLMAFGCGIDSFVCDYIERKIRRSSSIPFTVITIDEHSGEAGLNTRIEAFIDMIRWRNRNENNIPAHG